MALDTHRSYRIASQRDIFDEESAAGCTHVDDMFSPCQCPKSIMNVSVNWQKKKCKRGESIANDCRGVHTCTQRIRSLLIMWMRHCNNSSNGRSFLYTHSVDWWRCTHHIAQCCATIYLSRNGRWCFATMHTSRHTLASLRLPWILRNRNKLYWSTEGHKALRLDHYLRFM